MRRINLKHAISNAIGEEWHGFALRHPRLAQVLDNDLLVEEAVNNLADNREFRAAMERAETLGMGADVLNDVVVRYVREWLERLF